MPKVRDGVAVGHIAGLSIRSASFALRTAGVVSAEVLRDSTRLEDTGPRTTSTRTGVPLRAPSGGVAPRMSRPARRWRSRRPAAGSFEARSIAFGTAVASIVRRGFEQLGDRCAAVASASWNAAAASWQSFSSLGAMSRRRAAARLPLDSTSYERPPRRRRDRHHGCRSDRGRSRTRCRRCRSRSGATSRRSCSRERSTAGPRALPSRLPRDAGPSPA